MKKRLKLLLICLFMGSGLLVAQTQRVTGIVISEEDDQPVIGASILIKGTGIGTVTDANGRFILPNAPNSAILQVSFIGMATQEVAARPNIRVVLKPDAQQLDEVEIVVAYGVAKKSSLTGAVSSIDAATIEKRPVSSASGILEGAAPGIQVNNTYGEPGADATIRIRGFGSVNGSNNPLYVLDGVAFGGNISDINPNDIESITVLKDAASAALYGNRASNGVILITTKKGKSNRTSVRVNANQGVYNRGIAEYDRMGSDDFMETMWIGYRNSLLTKSPASYPTTESANAKASETLISDYLKTNIYNQKNNALFDSNGKLVAGAQVLDGYKDDLDWYKGLERLGHRQEYNLNGDAASEQGNYYFSVGYLDEKGYVISSDFQRFTGRANINLTPKQWLRTGLSLSGSHQTTNNTNGTSTASYVNPFMYARQIAPIYPVHLHDPETGNYVLDENGNKQYDNGEGGRNQYIGRHVIWENELDMDRTYRNTLIGQAYVDIIFLKDFTFTTKGDLNVRNSENQTYNSAIIGDGYGNHGRAKRVIYRYKNYTMQEQLTWRKKINSLHTFDALAAHENYYYNYGYLYGYKTTETFAGGTELINFTNITSLDGYQNNYRTESYLSRLRYNYDEKYFAEASFRRDGSSRFAPGKRWGNFWSVGGSWVVTEEDFLKPYAETINNLKFRVSYGEVGNDASVDYYGYMALYDLNQNANITAAYKVQNEALDIQWETASSLGVALEGRLFKRANFSLEYFDKRSQDLLFDVQLPLSVGANSTSSAEATVTKNLGSVSNRGIEISADVDVIKSKGLTWNIGANVTFLKNKILTLPEQNREKGIVSGIRKYAEGHDMYDFWLYQYVGVDQLTGNALYLPDLDSYYLSDATEDEKKGKSALPEEYLVMINGKPYSTFTTYAKRDWSGSVIPKAYGSISSSLRWNNFTLSALGTYSFGGKTLDYSYQSLMSMSGSVSTLHSDLLKAWNGVPAGITESSLNRIDPNGIPVVDFERSSRNNATSTRFLLDGSYFVIKNIALNYAIPHSLVKRLDLSDVGLTFSVENLATFTSLKGMNPQQSFAGTSDNVLVTARVFSLGVNIKL